jgi:S1-C subfamily serine protease
LKAGDRIIKIAGREVKNVYDYTYALGEMKAGVEYEVELVRENAVVKVTVTPEGRK